jgi:predicted CoA-binding protein
VFRTVEHLLRPKTIALLGASDSSRGGWVQEIYDNLEFSGFPAKLYLVNPKRRELWGRPVYPNFAAIPEAVDLALTIIPTVAVVDTLAEAAANGLKCALIYAAQFGEGGDAEGQKRAQALPPCPTSTGFAFPTELHGLAALRESSCSIRPSAYAVSSRARSASYSSRAERFNSGCSRRRCAASIFPTRYRAATNWISISPTTSIS